MTQTNFRIADGTRPGRMRKNTLPVVFVLVLFGCGRGIPDERRIADPVEERLAATFADSVLRPVPASTKFVVTRKQILFDNRDTFPKNMTEERVKTLLAEEHVYFSRYPIETLNEKGAPIIGLDEQDQYTIASVVTSLKRQRQIETLTSQTEHSPLTVWVEADVPITTVAQVLSSIHGDLFSDVGMVVRNGKSLGTIPASAALRYAMGDDENAFYQCQLLGSHLKSVESGTVWALNIQGVRGLAAKRRFFAHHRCFGVMADALGQTLAPHLLFPSAVEAEYSYYGSKDHIFTGYQIDYDVDDILTPSDVMDLWQSNSQQPTCGAFYLHAEEGVPWQRAVESLELFALWGLTDSLVLGTHSQLRKKTL